MGKKVQINSNVYAGPGEPLLFISGPCQIESLEHSLRTASYLQQCCEKYPVNPVFKSSYDKANRTSIRGARGPGLEEGLRILEEVHKETGLPVMTDVHSPAEAAAAGEIVDIIQTPAFLCRQTDLLIAAGAAGKAVNIKKGQFMAPEDMKFAVEKVSSTGNCNVMVCERGVSFGYRDLVVDMRSLVIMKDLGIPVVFDATHSVQVPGGRNGSSGGNNRFVEPLARAASAVGIEGLFIECHEDPLSAPSDGASMLPLSRVETLVAAVCRIRESAGM